MVGCAFARVGYSSRSGSLYLVFGDGYMIYSSDTRIQIIHTHP